MKLNTLFEMFSSRLHRAGTDSSDADNELSAEQTELSFQYSSFKEFMNVVKRLLLQDERLQEINLIDNVLSISSKNYKEKKYFFVVNLFYSNFHKEYNINLYYHHDNIYANRIIHLYNIIDGEQEKGCIDIMFLSHQLRYNKDKLFDISALELKSIFIDGYGCFVFDLNYKNAKFFANTFKRYIFESRPL